MHKDLGDTDRKEEFANEQEEPENLLNSKIKHNVLL